MDGGVGGEEGIANEARLLLGYEDGVSGVEEAGEGGRSGGGPGGGPRGGKIESGGGFSIEECLKLGEESQGDVGGFSCAGGREIDGLDGCGVIAVEWKVGVEGNPGGFPDSRITAPMIVSLCRLCFWERWRRRLTRSQQCLAQAPKAKFQLTAPGCVWVCSQRVPELGRDP